MTTINKFFTVLLLISLLLGAIGQIGVSSVSAAPLMGDWNKSSLEFKGSCEGDCYEVRAKLCNSGDGDMTGSVTWEVWFAASGNPKNGSKVASDTVGPLTAGQCVWLSYGGGSNPLPAGNYMFRAFQEEGHPGSGELWSNECNVGVCPVPTSTKPPDTATPVTTEPPPGATETPVVTEPPPGATETPVVTEPPPGETDTPTPTVTSTTKVTPAPSLTPTPTDDGQTSTPTPTDTDIPTATATLTSMPVPLYWYEAGANCTSKWAGARNGTTLLELTVQDAIGAFTESWSVTAEDEAVSALTTWETRMPYGDTTVNWSGTYTNSSDEVTEIEGSYSDVCGTPTATPGNTPSVTPTNGNTPTPTEPTGGKTPTATDVPVDEPPSTGVSFPLTGLWFGMRNFGLVGFMASIVGFFLTRKREEV